MNSHSSWSPNLVVKNTINKYELGFSKTLPGGRHTSPFPSTVGMAGAEFCYNTYTCTNVSKKHQEDVLQILQQQADLLKTMNYQGEG